MKANSSMAERVLIHALEFVGAVLITGPIVKLLSKSGFGRALLPHLVTLLMILLLLGMIALIVLVPEIWRKALAVVCSLLVLGLLIFWIRITTSRRSA